MTLDGVSGRMSLARLLWSESSRTSLLLAAASVAVFLMLGTAELWTHESRWAVICQRMMRSGDYFHPYLLDQPYYDKPLLSYWLMIATARVLGALDERALRIPDALSGILTVWCTYRLGTRLFNRTTGLTAGYLLVSCFLFVFWSRVASADMLNVAGTVAAVTWYFERKDKPGFATYAVLFLILAVASLMKGLIAVAVAGLVLLPDLLAAGSWRSHLKPALLPAGILAAVAYFTPFLLSSSWNGEGYGQSGLAMVFRENLVRYFDPFDHQEPVYAYLLHLPVYVLPWSLLLPWVVARAAREWRTLSPPSRWAISASGLIFAFLTASGSRRSYYVLPIVPFVALVIADWISSPEAPSERRRLAAGAAVASWAAMLVWFGALVPYGFTYGGQRLFVREVRAATEKKAPWSEWQLVASGAPPSVAYYFGARSDPELIPPGDRAALQSFLDRHPRTIIVTKRRYLQSVRSAVPEAALVEEPSRLPAFLRSEKTDSRDMVALIP